MPTVQQQHILRTSFWSPFLAGTGLGFRAGGIIESRHTRSPPAPAACCSTQTGSLSPSPSAKTSCGFIACEIKNLHHIVGALARQFLVRGDYFALECRSERRTIEVPF